MGRILALDYGRKRVGISISDESKTIAQILVPPAVNNHNFLKEIGKIIGRYEIEKVIIGLPISLGSESGQMQKEVEKFAAALRARFSLPSEMVDERFTSVEAKKMLAAEGAGRADQKVLKDNLSAQVLLQQYLQAAENNEKRKT